MIFWHIAITILSVEVFWWGISLNAHSRLMKDMGEKDLHLPSDKGSCFQDNWIRVFMASVLATGLSMGVALWWAVATYVGVTDQYVYPQWIAAGVHLTHIHLFAIIARCACMEISEWPPISRKISRILHCAGFFKAEAKTECEEGIQ